MRRLISVALVAAVLLLPMFPAHAEPGAHRNGGPEVTISSSFECLSADEGMFWVVVRNSGPSVLDFEDVIRAVIKVSERSSRQPSRRSGSGSGSRCASRTGTGPTSATRCSVRAHDLKRPAKPLNGRSALVRIPGGAATTARIALSAGSPVTVIPIDANASGEEKSVPGFGKIMCLL